MKWCIIKGIKLIKTVKVIMESFIFALNAVLPIIIMIVLGYILKKKGFMDGTFAKKANTLVFRLFLPTMLFLNVYNIDNIGGIDVGYVVYVVIALLIIFVLSIPVVKMLTKKSERRGALLQAGFRSTNPSFKTCPDENIRSYTDGYMPYNMLVKARQA